MNLITKKSINLYVSDALVEEWYKLMMRLGIEEIIAWAAVEQIYKDGWWVGGTCELYNTKLVFKPNKLNSSIHKNLKVLEIPVGEILEVRVDGGFVTGIIVLKLSDTEIRFRCWGAKDFSETIRNTIQASNV